MKILINIVLIFTPLLLNAKDSCRDNEKSTSKVEQTNDTTNNIHKLFEGVRTWDIDDVHSEWYKTEWDNYWDPVSWTTPDYLNGNLYLRFEVLEKASDTTLNMQLCLWYGVWSIDGKCEYCIYKEDLEWFEFSRVGDVVYVKYPPVSRWHHHAGREWDTAEGFNKILFQMRLGDKEVKLGDNPHHMGEEARKHLPVTWKAEAYLVPKGESFIVPKSWTNNPWEK